MIAVYLKKLKARRLSPKTIDLYRTELQTLERLKRDKEAIEAHLSRCEASTHVRKLIIWRAYLKTVGETYLDDFEDPQVHRKNVSYLNESEIKILHAYAEVSLDAEDRMFIELGLNLGLRLSEILQVNKHRLDGESLVVTRKGGNEQAIGPLPESLVREIKTFEGFTRSKRYFQSMMHRIQRGCGFSKKITPHTLRHSFATRALVESNDLVTIKEALGHASLKSTERYLHTNSERLKKLFNRGTIL